MPAAQKRLSDVAYVRHIKNFFSQNNQVRVYQCHMSKVHSVDWNVDGRKLASGKPLSIVHDLPASFCSLRLARQSVEPNRIQC